MATYIENIDEIKSKLDAKEVLRLVQPGKIILRGGELRCACPIHGGDGDENFALNVENHKFKCHSNGCKGTNLVDLYMQCAKIPYHDAVEALATEFGIGILYRDQKAANLRSPTTIKNPHPRQPLNQVEVKQSKSYTQEDVIRCWAEASPQGEDTYFSKKGIPVPPIAKYGKNPSGYESTLTPLRDIDGNLKGITSLSEGGKYNYGETKGAFALLGELTSEGAFYIGEGIATMATAWEATQREIPAVSCGSWSNIVHVITAIKAKYPNAKPIQLIDGDEGGKGLEAAMRTQSAFPDATFRKPSFESFPPIEGVKPADFNDIISVCNQSREVVAEQLKIEFELPVEKERLHSKGEPGTSSEKSKPYGACASVTDGLETNPMYDRKPNMIQEGRVKMTTSDGTREEVCPEMLVLGGMLNSAKNASISLRLVDENNFSDPKHKIIFKAIREVYDEKRVVDISLISKHLTVNDNLKVAGGLPYLITLPQYAGTSIHIEAYCDDLKKETAKRQLISLIRSTSHDLDQGADPSKIMEKMKDKITGIEKLATHAESPFRHLLENNSEQKIIDELKRTSPGVSTGFTIGEEKIIIPGGALSVVAMPTGHGKTTTLINFSLGVLNHHHDKSVYFFTYEESDAAIQTYFLNTYINKKLSRNNRESIKSHFIDGDTKYIDKEMQGTFLSDKKAFFTHLIDRGRLRVFYSDMSAEELIAAIGFIKKHTNVGLVCIDYMQLLRILRSFPGSRQEELKEICLMLKNCAIETGLPILLGAQFNRKVVAEADLSPTEIGEAGDIERIANFIIGGWNRSCAGFSRDGNRSKTNLKNIIPPEPAIYFEVLKGRGIGTGHNSIFDFNGNTGKLSNRAFNSNTNETPVPQRRK